MNRSNTSRAERWARAIRARVVAAALGGVTLTAPVALAVQNTPPRQTGAGGARPAVFVLERLEQEAKALGLSDDQAKQVEDLFSQTRNAMRRLARETNADDAQGRLEAFRDTVLELNEGVTNVLTPEQRPKWAAAFEKVREEARERFAGAAGNAGGANNAGNAARPPNAQPENRPADARPEAANGRFAGGLLRLRETLGELDLSNEQRAKVDEILRDAQQKMAALRRDAAGDPQALRGKVAGIMDEVRGGLTAVLTPEQQRTLREKMEAAAPPNDVPARPAERPAARTPASPKPDETMQGGEPMTPAPKPAAPSTPRAAAPVTPTPSPAPAPPAAPKVEVASVRVGQPAPDLALTRIDGKPTTLAAYKGKPTVLIFGSFSCPSFRDRLPLLEELKKQYKRDVNFVVIYTREAHPMGGWEVERNLDQEIKVAAHQTIGDRLTAARQMQTALDVTLDMAVDPFDDTASATFAGFPNGAAVLDRDGKIVLMQKWCDPWGIKAAIDGLKK